MCVFFCRCLLQIAVRSYFASFHLCKAAMHVRVCEPRGDGISSTEHLLDNPVLRARYYVLSKFPSCCQV